METENALNTEQSGKKRTGKRRRWDDDDDDEKKKVYELYIYDWNKCLARVFMSKFKQKLRIIAERRDKKEGKKNPLHQIHKQ